MNWVGIINVFKVINHTKNRKNYGVILNKKIKNQLLAYRKK